MMASGPAQNGLSPMAVEIVRKKRGNIEPFSLEKLKRRLSRCCTGLQLVDFGPYSDSIGSGLYYPYGGINVEGILQKTIDGLFNEISTDIIDKHLEEVCAYQQQNHPDFSLLAGRLAVSRLWKQCPKTFSDTIKKCYENLEHCCIASDVYEFVMKHRDVLDAAIVRERDNTIAYFGIRTLQVSYLIKLCEEIVETPQYLYMRVACAIYCGDLESAIKTYELLSTGFYSHATPTMFYAGTKKPQTSSCFLLTTVEDSVDGIFETIKRCALISAAGGGIGVSIQNVRSAGAYVRGFNGNANGILPLLKVYNSTTRYINQGAGRRRGAFAFYLEPWHPDVLKFIMIKRNFGDENERARDLFPALWVPDLFMQRVRDGKIWTLIDPDAAPGLDTHWGAEFNALYENYEKEGTGVKQKLQARELWDAIISSQIETGVPYILYKDAANLRSNHRHRGCIKSANLCCEVIQYTSKDEIAVCNLASICLPKFVEAIDTTTQQSKLHISTHAKSMGLETDSEVDSKILNRINFDHLRDVTRHVLRSLDQTIERGWTPTPETRNSNTLNRAVGIGVQGLADLFSLLEIPFDSKEAFLINQRIFENIYYSALDESCRLAELFGPYPTFKGSPSSYGFLQFDLTSIDALIRSNNIDYPVSTPQSEYLTPVLQNSPAKKKIQFLHHTDENFHKLFGIDCHCGCHDGDTTVENVFDSCCSCYYPKEHLSLNWIELKKRIMKFGLRNSLVTAPMPTASSAQILGNCEAFEPFTSNMYRRSVLAGEFITVNHHLVSNLQKLGLWDAEMKEHIIAKGGSIQFSNRIPLHLKNRFKTVWEISQKHLIRQSVDRGYFVDQSQSLNLFIAKPTASKITAMLFYGWKMGLKTGLYYLRTRPSSDPIPVTVSVVAAARETSSLLDDPSPLGHNLNESSDLHRTSQMENDAVCHYCG